MQKYDQKQMNVRTFFSTKTYTKNRQGWCITTYNLPIYTIKGTHLLGKSLVNQTKQHKVTKIYI